MAGALIGALAALFVALVGHFLLWLGTGNGYESSGATQGLDQWTYYSMARAVWRSPNGITYSYPYQLYWPTPPVLFQLPITVLAWIGKLTGLPVAFEIGRIAGAAASGAALATIGSLFPRGFYRRWFYVAAILGGGLFSLVAVGMAIDTAGLPGLTEVYQYGHHAQGVLYWWLPYLASNLRMPLECVYHGMVLGALACLVKRRYIWAWVLGLAIWASNPFSAVALHAVVLPWLLWRAVESRGSIRRRFVGWLAAWLLVNIAAAVYYGWFLPQWPLFRELGSLYKMAYTPPLSWWRFLCLTMPYGLGLVISLGNRRLRQIIWGRPAWRLFAILAVVHCILIQQSVILGKDSMQSYHYDRGYLHLGLVVVAWRVVIELAHKYKCLRSGDALQQWWPWKFGAGVCRKAAWITAIVAIITCGDQFLFGMYCVFGPAHHGIVESNYVRLVEQIPAKSPPATVLVRSAVNVASYVTAFSPAISWDAPETMVVPYYNERDRWVTEALENKYSGLAELGIDYAIIPTGTFWDKKLKSQKWVTINESGDYILLKKPPMDRKEFKSDKFNDPHR